jgi:FKBP-type peptidyl-prolyl cis-trans isomerase
MKSSKISIGILVVALSFVACQNVEFKKSSSGIPYKIFSSKKGDSVKVGSFVKYDVIVKTKDTVIFNSYAAKAPIFVQMKPQTEKPAYNNIRGTVEGLLLNAKEGDSLYLVQSSDSLLKQNPDMSVYKKGQQVITTIKVQKVFKTQDEANADMYKAQIPTKEELAQNYKMMKENVDAFMKDSANAASLQRDDKIIEDYLKAHNINARKTEWGVYYQELAPGSGAKPTLRQYAKVNYKGMDLSGQVFDQGTYPVQIGGQGSIPGFWLGIMEMQKGGKGKVYIPSLLGYGTRGQEPKIKANELLIFELELVDVSDIPFREQMQQPNQ